jgi:hypothetical protein
MQLAAPSSDAHASSTRRVCAATGITRPVPGVAADGARTPARVCTPRGVGASCGGRGSRLLAAFSVLGVARYPSGRCLSERGVAAVAPYLVGVAAVAPEGRDACLESHRANVPSSAIQGERLFTDTADYLTKFAVSFWARWTGGLCTGLPRLREQGLVVDDECSECIARDGYRASAAKGRGDKDGSV